jgi:Uma2 family endonuclease
MPQAPWIILNGALRVPPGLSDLEAFRSWARSMQWPEHTRLGYFGGTIWVEMVMERFFAHNQVKGEFGAVLLTLVKASGLGRYSPDGMVLTCPAADLYTVPDGLFVTYASLQSGRVRCVPGQHGDTVELEGAPEMVLEVVSDTSVEKDTIILPDLYCRAGVAEFWRVDARGEPRFEIFRLTEAGYVPTQESDGWWRSDVFGHSFRLTHQADPLGQPQFTLAFRA